MLRFGRRIALSRWRPRPLNTISGFAFVDVAAFRRSKSISKPNFVDISQLMAKISALAVFSRNALYKSTFYFFLLRYNYFRFCKTNVRHIGNLLSISTICQKCAHYSASGYTELCPNRSIHCGNMTSYPFLKMAATTAEYYFRFRIC